MSGKRLILVGLMGCGKSTVGRLAATRMGLPFFDSDSEIVRTTGVEISTIFEVEGEAAFRQREASAIESIVDTHPTFVLATGGGAVLLERNRARLRGAGIVIYIHAHPKTLLKRVGSNRGRPLLNGADPLSRLETLYVARDALYRETAHAIIHVDGDQPTSVAIAVSRKFDELLEARA